MTALLMTSTELGKAYADRDAADVALRYPGQRRAAIAREQREVHTIETLLEAHPGLNVREFVEAYNLRLAHIASSVLDFLQDLPEEPR